MVEVGLSTRFSARFLLLRSLLHFVKLILSGALAITTVLPAKAAEEIVFQRGLFTSSLRVEDLERFAEDGTVSKELRGHLERLGVNEEEWETYQSYLQLSVEVDPLVLDRYLNSSFGDEILTEIGNTVQTVSRLNGKSSLRAAINRAARDPDGLTPLNVLRQLPIDPLVQFDDAQALHQAARQIIDGTISAIESIQQLSAEEIAAQSVDIDYSELPDLRLPGRYGVERFDFELEDVSRDRRFKVFVYRPHQWLPGKTPVVVLSHGLGDAPEVFRVEAEHLASYGFFVAVPQHPGSDALYQAAFRRGIEGEIYQIDEFLERPRDVTHLLDELERLNAAEYEGRLDLENVGMGGHSYGGYTALALAGAKIDFQNLAEDCAQRFRELNLSLLLQCDALKLLNQDYDFRDSRITSIAVKNPFTSSIFGPDGIAEVEVPVMLIAGSHDPVTPAVYEQFRAFRWFSTKPRYLLLMEGQAHVDISALDVGVTQILDLVESLNLAPPEQLEQYSKALSVAFFETHTARRVDHRLYLRSAYADHLSQEQLFKIYFVSEGSSEDLINQ